MLSAIVKRMVLFSAVWLALTGAALDALAFGVPAVAASVWLSLRLLPPVGALRLWRLALLLPGFLAGSLVGGLDVARRALRPRLNIRPGWVLHPSRLASGGRVALGGELSLMPGTLSAGCQDGHLLVHVLDLGAGFERSIPVEEHRIAGIMHGASKKAQRGLPGT